jgi:hypothetical protein
MSVSTSSRGLDGSWPATDGAAGGWTSFGGSAPSPPLTNRDATNQPAATSMAGRQRPTKH